MRFTGTHIPGAHTIVVPNPAPIVLPERKIIAATEAAAWHEKRGGAAVSQDENGGGGDTHPLLTDLAGGWELTAGPQQTLDSSGVVASGPLDLTANGVTYGSNGVRMPGSDYEVYCPYAAAINPDPHPFMIAATIRLNAFSVASNTLFACQHRAEDPYTYSWNCNLNSNGSVLLGTNFGSLNAESDPTTLATLTAYVLLFGRKADGTLWIRFNGSSVENGLDTDMIGDGQSPLLLAPVLSGPPDFDGWIKNSRLWIGANANTIANNSDYLTFLLTNPTDAALVAYTGA